MEPSETLSDIVNGENPVEEVSKGIAKTIDAIGFKALEEGRIWLAPDCGMKTNTESECIQRLENIAIARQQILQMTESEITRLANS